ncbi:MAG: acyl-CoA dehydrogenase family protein [Acidimicrobiia bacterium]
MSLAATTTASAERRDLLESLRETARVVLGRESASERVRGLLDDPVGHDPALWATMADLGWLGLHAPESLGGSGAGFGELAVVAEELGRHLTPSPFLGSAVLATSALLEAGDTPATREWVPRLCEGSAIGAAVLTGSDGAVGADTVDLRLGGGRLSGTAGYVIDAAAADLLIVGALSPDDSGDGVVCALPTSRGGIDMTPVPTVDATRRLATLTFADVEVRDAEILASGRVASALCGRLLDLAAVGLALDAAGGARHTLEQTVAYAGEREQFGRRIGSFQAVKHICANMLIAVEGAAAASSRAVEAVERDSTAVPEASSTAKSHALESYVAVAGDAVQVHGGVGFTWEFDCHLFLKRALLGRSMFGDTRYHRERLAALLDPRG